MPAISESDLPGSARDKTCFQPAALYVDRMRVLQLHYYAKFAGCKAGIKKGIHFIFGIRHIYIIFCINNYDLKLYFIILCPEKGTFFWNVVICI